MTFRIEDAFFFLAVSQWQTSSRGFQIRTSLEFLEFLLPIHNLCRVNSRGDVGLVAAFSVILLTHR